MRVKYNGTNRSELRGQMGTVVSDSGNSRLVQFDNGEKAWVGKNYLIEEPVSVISNARKAVQEKIRKLEKEISSLRSQVSKLNAANKALKDME